MRVEPFIALLKERIFFFAEILLSQPDQIDLILTQQHLSSLAKIVLAV